MNVEACRQDRIGAPPRRRGRPAKPEATVPVSTRLAPGDADQLIQLSRKHRMPVAALLRQIVIVVIGPRQ